MSILYAKSKSCQQQWQCIFVSWIYLRNALTVQQKHRAAKGKSLYNKNSVSMNKM